MGCLRWALKEALVSRHVSSDSSFTFSQKCFQTLAFIIIISAAFFIEDQFMETCP